MTIESAIIAGLSAVATATRSLRSVVTGGVKGDLTGLLTTVKTSIVAAINELKTASGLGFRYTFSMTAQPRDTWVQPTVLTLVYNTATAVVTLATGNFTFGAATVANVAGMWLFSIEAEATVAAALPVGVEVRVGGTSIGRATMSAALTTLGINTRANVCIPYRLVGAEVVTFHFIFDYQPFLGATTSTVIGTISGHKL